MQAAQVAGPGSKVFCPAARSLAARSLKPGSTRAGAALCGWNGLVNWTLDPKGIASPCQACDNFGFP